MPRRRSRDEPTVVFVDDGPWESFFQLAAMLRQSGIRTVRVSVGTVGWQVGNILFDRHISFPFRPNPEQLSRALSDEYITDVQPVESLAATTYRALDLLPKCQRSNNWEGRSVLIDKLVMATQLRNLGLRTPDTLLIETTTATEAVAQFSLPIAFKRRISSSGSGVEVFNSLDDLQAFIATVEQPSDWFFERFISGVSLVCATCVNNRRLDVVATYEVLKRVYVRGPSSMVEFRYDAKLISDARTLIDELGVSGLMCFDVIRDAEGVDWIHDLNPRVFAGMSTCQQAGLDFHGAYINYLLGHRPLGPSRFAGARTTSFVFPEGRKDLSRSESVGTGGIHALKWAWRGWRLLGARYFLYFTIERPVSSFRQHRGYLRGGSRRTK